MGRIKNVRSKKYEVHIDHTDLMELWEKQGGRCALSGVMMTHHIYRGDRKDFNVSIDRIRPHEGYTKDNIQLVAWRVNIMKNDMDEAMMSWWVRTIHAHACT